MCHLSTLQIENAETAARRIPAALIGAQRLPRVE